VRLLGGGAEAGFAVGFVIRAVAVEPGHFAVALEGQDMGGDAVEKPAVKGDHDGAATKHNKSSLVTGVDSSECTQ